MIKRFISALAVAVLSTVGGLTATASPASAADDCPTAHLCIWDSVGFAGNRWSWTVGYIRTLPNDCLILGSGPNNKASSVFMNGQLAGTLYVRLWDGNRSGAARNIVTDNYLDDNMLVSPGMSNFSNVTSSICILG